MVDRDQPLRFLVKPNNGKLITQSRLYWSAGLIQALRKFQAQRRGPLRPVWGLDRR